MFAPGGNRWLIRGGGGYFVRRKPLKTIHSKMLLLLPRGRGEAAKRLDVKS
jgi:hypothetical protein